MIDYKDINQRLLAKIETLMHDWLPGGKKSAREWVCGDIEGNPGESFSVNMETGVWAEFAGQMQKGGDLISLWAAKRGLKQNEAAQELSDYYGFTKPPEVSKLPNMVSIKGVRPTARWIYHNETGLPVSLVTRYDKPDGKKFFSQQSFINGKWEYKAHPNPKPLYNLPRLLKQPDQAIIVEGEKTADFLQPLVTMPVTTWIGGCNGVKNADWSVIKGRKIIIIPDADGPGHLAAEFIAMHLLKQCPEIRIIDTYDMPEGWDVADSKFKTGQEFLAWAKPRISLFNGHSIIIPAAASAVQIVESERTQNDNEVDVSNPDDKFILWEKLGIPMSRNGTPINNLVTVKKIFDQDKRYNNIWYDEFYKNVFINGRPLSDQTETDITYHLQSTYGLAKIETSVVSRAIQYYSGQNRKNDPLDWLNTLKWDGVKRVETLFSDVYGTPDDEYHRDVARYYLCSIVARIINPGCQADNMVVFIGKQGDYKSTSIQALVGPKWYACASKQQEFGSDKMTSAIQGKLLLEIGELASFKNADIESIKNCCTIRSDRYRVPFDRHSQDLPRSCLFVGTTNRKLFLYDQTGNRRFLPVNTGRIDVRKITELRDQLFAEARAIVESSADGRVWWEPVADKHDAQDEHRSIDPVEEALAGMTDIQIERMSQANGLDGGFKTIDVATQVLKLNFEGALSKSMSARISDSLIALGYEYKNRHTRINDKWVSVKLWKKPQKIGVEPGKIMFEE